ncbi:MAG: GMC family oxidoreductase [Acidobacteriota bacterium]|nr:GMC family oxidoreductase [Acidobacteriota bacterium]
MAKDNGSYDVIVVGSGASGGWAAKRFSEAGLKVAMVDAGRQQSDSNFTEHEPAFKLKFRDMAPEVIRKTRPVQKDCYACMEYNYDWFCNDIDEPYTTYENMPFSWQGRLRVTGGRTNVWGRQSYRFSDLDFKAASHDGYGADWPLSYKDVAPYYDIVEKYVGITGMREGVYELPDGEFQPPMGMTCAEQLFRSKVKEKLGYTVTLGRSANLTQETNGRPACHYCGPCERGCITHSYFNSYFTTVADAMRSGNCTHIANAMVYQVLMDTDKNRANGVLYIDRVTRQPKEVRGRAVVLCAQSLESVRVLFNSKSRQYPNGLANSSGVLGHYLMDHITGAGAFGEIPNLGPKPNINGPHRPDGIYVIRFRNTHNGPRAKNYLRGFGYQGGGAVEFNRNSPGFGAAFINGIRDYITGIGVGGFGECLARWDNYVEIDPGVVDTFGIPVLRFHMTYGENEFNMFKDIAASGAEMLEAVGAKNIFQRTRPNSPGWAIHEVGIARMGDDPKASVLNQFEQTHDVKNLFVMDGSSFCSSACQNPTLTIMAVCVRSCDYMMEEMKKGNI